VSDMRRTARDNPVYVAKYFLPSLLYCVYNNLVYINLGTFDPGTYNVLMQFKISLTGVIYQIVFQKSLNRNQWLAIVLITFGCVIKESGKLSNGMGEAFMADWLCLLGQMCCSVFAGVYTEALLKGDVDASVTTNLQNCFMYFQSIICNVGFLQVQGTLGEAVSFDNASAVFTPAVLSIILIMSSVGVVTGFFLKHLDSVLKSISGALEVVFTMILSFLIFGVSIDLMSFIAAIVVGCGVALYASTLATD